jgi:hypothetical protein
VPASLWSPRRATPAPDKDFDRFNGLDRNHRTASAAGLRDIAATEHAFDQHLTHLAQPAQAAAWAHTLIRANEARAALTLRAADSTSLLQLDSLRPSLTAANVPAQRAVSAIRATLGMPPPIPPDQRGLQHSHGKQPVTHRLVAEAWAN